MARVFVTVTALSADRVIKAKDDQTGKRTGEPTATVWSCEREDKTQMNVVIDDSNIINSGDQITLEQTTAGEPVLDDGGNVIYTDDTKTTPKLYTKSGLKFRGRKSIVAKIAVAKQQLELAKIEKETNAL